MSGIPDSDNPGAQRGLQSRARHSWTGRRKNFALHHIPHYLKLMLGRDATCGERHPSCAAVRYRARKSGENRGATAVGGCISRLFETVGGIGASPMLVVSACSNIDARDSFFASLPPTPTLTKVNVECRFVNLLGGLGDEVGDDE